MRRRPGRPRASLEAKILADMHQDEERLEEIVAEKLRGSSRTPWRGAYEAAYLRWTLEKGSPFAKACCQQLIKKLRGTKWARANYPSGRLSDRDFLERFIEAHAPGFDWREDARLGENDDRIRKQEDERIAKERAEDAHWDLACVTKFHTPGAPDGWQLCALAWEYRKRRRFTRRTPPTLRELKLATAIPERTLKKTIEGLRPKSSEVIKESLRNRFINRGAAPLRYGPRLVIGVLNEFLNRLPGFPISQEERKRLRRTALLVKRAFAARLGRCRRST